MYFATWKSVFVITFDVFIEKNPILLNFLIPFCIKIVYNLNGEIYRFGEKYEKKNYKKYK